MARQRRMRLDAFLARSGLGTRSQVRRLIARGRVQLDGSVCRRAAELVVDRPVAVDGHAVESPPEFVHVALHKPTGFACSHAVREAPIIDELLPRDWIRLGLQAAGRLDRDTSGLLVLSTDGDVVHRLTHPTRKLPKRYRAGISGQLPDDAVERCAAGLPLGPGEPDARPASLRIDADDRITLVLQEGRHHQVRRMLASLGVEVLELHRDRIGDYELPDDLVLGAFRRLEPWDLERLLSASSL